MITVLYEDNHLLVLNKPANMLIQGDNTGDESLLDWGKAYIKEQYAKAGEVFLGLVHRLDRPVSGVVVFARTSKAASRLSAQFAEHTNRKIYWALVHGKSAESGVLENQILREEKRSRIVASGGQYAELSFQRLGYQNGLSWLEIELKTGRHHQIRVQFQHIGLPLYGENFYHRPKTEAERAYQRLALHARSLTIEHPTLKETMTFTAEANNFFPSGFKV